MKRKLLSLVLVCILATGIMAGCTSDNNGGSSETSPAADTGSSSAPAEKTTLDLWYYWETEGHQVTLNGVIEDYNASQDAYQVTASYIPFADFKKQLSIGATADKLPDIVIIDSPDHASYASMGIFADISDKKADLDIDQYFEGPVNSCSLDGKLYGIPFGVNCLALYYNEDMLADANCEVPATWDQLKQVAQATTKGNVTGLAMCSKPDEEGTFNFVPFLWSTGTDSFNINNAQGIKALTLYKDLIGSGAMDQEVINWTQGDVMNQFISGNIAMMINGPWQVPTMREQAPEDLKWNVALIPKDSEYASVLGGENFAVVNGDNVDGAVDFLKFATNAENVSSYINNFGYIAARKDVAEGQFDDDEIMQKFTEQMEYAKPRGPHAQWPQISDALSLAMNEVITSTSSPEDAAAKAQATIDGIVK